MIAFRTWALLEHTTLVQGKANIFGSALIEMMGIAKKLVILSLELNLL